MCASTLVMAALGAVSTGGVTAAVVKRWRSKRIRREPDPAPAPPLKS